MTDANPSLVDVDTDSDLVIRSREADEPVSESVVRAVSEATGTDPLEMEQLGRVIDPDALDALFLGESAWADGTGPVRGTVSFRFNGCDVVVHADGRTVVKQSSATRP